ncbi:hypothetical protein PVAP13_5NG147781 [Panicum virgatum]|nr:hypothetical protein PVAP13_5NG147781 [Panicum virgatum]
MHSVIPSVSPIMSSKQDFVKELGVGHPASSNSCGHIKDSRTIDIRSGIHFQLLFSCQIYVFR